MIKWSRGNVIEKLSVHGDVTLWLVTEIKKWLSALYRHNWTLFRHSVFAMMWRVVRLCCCLIAKSQQQVFRNVSAGVLKRYNSTAAVTQVRPEQWECAKPFEDIPGPKPLPIIGNAWRFIPYLGNVICFFNSFKWQAMKWKYAAQMCSILLTLFLSS